MVFHFDSVITKQLEEQLSWLSENFSDGGRVLWWSQLQGKQGCYNAPAQISFSGDQIDGLGISCVM